MPDTASPSVFISYSREDSAFVDRLEADLRARGFLTWVDRRRLEGGQDWQAEIDRAIDRHTVMVLILSPNSTNSPAVTHEYQYATTRNKQVLPVLLQECTPHYAIPQQWIEDFLRRDYATGLNALLGTLLFQQLSLTAPSRELYERATALKGHSQIGDKEQAAVILQRILDRDPGYLQGLVKGDLDQLTQSLYPSRAQNLRQQVIAARKTGEYGVEASTLEALLALGHADPCAAEYLPLARQNSQFVDLYWVVQQQAAKGDLPDARDKLQFLWSKAPYYRDPANLAPKLGLTLPRSYEEVKARKGAEKQWREEEEAAKRERTREKEAAKYDLARELANVPDNYQQVRAEINAMSHVSAKDSINISIANIASSVGLSVDVEELHVSARKVLFYDEQSKSAAHRVQQYDDPYKGVWTLANIGRWFIFVIIVLGVIYFGIQNPSFFDLQISGPAPQFIDYVIIIVVIIGYLLFYLLIVFVISWIVSFLLAFLILLPFTLAYLGKRKRAVQDKAKAEEERKVWHKQWKSELKALSKQLQQGLQRQLDLQTSQVHVMSYKRTEAIIANYQQRLQEIAANCQQRIKAIEVVYPTPPTTDPLLACWERTKAG